MRNQASMDGKEDLESMSVMLAGILAVHLVGMLMTRITRKYGPVR
jgi:hypothetical protein